MLIDLFTFSAATAAEAVTDAAEEAGKWVLEEGKYLYAYLMRALGIEGGSVAAGLLMMGAVLLCILVPYLLGSLNPSIIFSRLIYKEDIRTYGSGNAGTTNTLRTYGPKMAVLIFCLDLLKAALAVLFGGFVLSWSVGGAIAGFFVVFGHSFPIYYKFKGGKGAACSIMVALLLSPISALIIIAVFALIVLVTRYISLGSVIGAMLFPFLNSVFYNGVRPNGVINLSAIAIMVLVLFMHRENIKRLLEGKESKISFKKTDKHDVAAHEQAKTEKNSTEPEKEYSDADFVKCSCGRLIPVSREVCVYCGERNKKYIPKPVEKKNLIAKPGAKQGNKKK